MKSWTITLLLLFCIGFLYGQGGGNGASDGAPQGDIVSLSGDSLILDRVLRLTSDGVIERDLYNNFDKARDLLEEALAIDPSNMAANYQMALTIQDDADAERALKHAKIALDSDTTNKWSMDLYAQRLLMSGRLSEAKGLYRKMIKLDPTEPNNYRILARLYQYTDLPYSAISVLDSAEVKIGVNPYLNQIKQQLLLSTNQEERALREVKEAVANSPRDLELRVSLAKIYSAMERDSLAEVEYKEALKIDSTSTPALQSLVEFYVKRAHTDGYFSTVKLLFNSKDHSLQDAINVVNKITNDHKFYRSNYVKVTELISILALKYPNQKQVIKLHANHLLAFGLVEEALELYKRQTIEQPTEIEYFKSVIEMEGYQRRMDSVSLYVKRALNLFPKSYELHITLANTKSYDKDYKGAMDSYATALKYITNDTLASTIWGYIGDLEYQTAIEDDKPKRAAKSMAKCYESYDRALVLFPDNLNVLNNYAYFLCEEQGGDLERALEMSKRSIEIYDKNPTHLDTYAWILYKLGRYEEAEKYIRTAVSLDTTKSPELPLHYGDILAAQGKNFMAEVYWRRAEGLGYPKEEIERRISELNKAEQ